MRKTLTQIVKEFQTFANNHKVIKQFEANPISDFTANNYLYPLLWLEVGNVQYAQGEARLSMSFYIVDRLLSDETNLMKVLSDSLMICDDLDAYFNEYEEDFGFYFSQDAPLSPIVYDFDDKVGGYKMDITVQVARGRNKNDIPI